MNPASNTLTILQNCLSNQVANRSTSRVHVEPRDLPDGEYNGDEDEWAEEKTFPVVSGLISVRARTFRWGGQRGVADLRGNRLRRSDFGLALGRSRSGVRASMWTSAMGLTACTSGDGRWETGTGATRNVRRGLEYTLGGDLR